MCASFFWGRALEHKNLTWNIQQAANWLSQVTFLLFGEGFLVIFTPPLGICTSNSFIYGGCVTSCIHWLQITKFYLLLRQHSHLKYAIAVHSGSYFRGWGFLKPLFHIVVRDAGKKEKKNTKKGHFLYAVFKVLIFFYKTSHKRRGKMNESKNKNTIRVLKMCSDTEIVIPKETWVNCLPNGVKRLKLLNGPTQQ